MYVNSFQTKGRGDLLQYYTFTIGGQRVGYYEIEEKPDGLFMNARMRIGDNVQENPFAVKVVDGRPTHVRRGDGAWHAVPDGAYPTSAYPLVLQAGLSRYDAYVEGTGAVETRRIRQEQSPDGPVWVEFVQDGDDERITRRFCMDGHDIVYINWGGTAESVRVPSLREATRGTAWEYSV